MPRVKKTSKYARRKARGIKDRQDYLKYQNRLKDTAQLFAGLAFGFGYVLVMGLAIGYKTPTDFIVAYILTALTGAMLTIREVLLVKASWLYWRLYV